jgi:hypothetical protein
MAQRIYKPKVAPTTTRGTVASLLARGRSGALDERGLQPASTFLQAVRAAFPALSSFLGQSPAQLIRFASLAKRLISMPISDTSTPAE